MMVTQVDKLRVLIPHWIEHNNEHAQDYRRWAEQTDEAFIELYSAIELIMKINQTLSCALNKLGGALPYDNDRNERSNHVHNHGSGLDDT